jgi:hypothetical protein
MHYARTTPLRASSSPGNALTKGRELDSVGLTPTKTLLLLVSQGGWPFTDVNPGFASGWLTPHWLNPAAGQRTHAQE